MTRLPRNQLAVLAALTNRRDGDETMPLAKACGLMQGSISSALSGLSMKGLIATEAGIKGIDGSRKVRLLIDVDEARRIVAECRQHIANGTGAALQSGGLAGSPSIPSLPVCDAEGGLSARADFDETAKAGDPATPSIMAIEGDLLRLYRQMFDAVAEREAAFLARLESILSKVDGRGPPSSAFEAMRRELAQTKADLEQAKSLAARKRPKLTKFGTAVEVLREHGHTVMVGSTDKGWHSVDNVGQDAKAVVAMARQVDPDAMQGAT